MEKQIKRAELLRFQLNSTSPSKFANSTMQKTLKRRYKIAKQKNVTECNITLSRQVTQDKRAIFQAYFVKWGHEQSVKI